MQQLTIRFEGYADQVLQPVDAGTARQCSEVSGSFPGGNPEFALGKLAVSYGETIRERMARAVAAVRAWLPERSETFTALCATGEGEVFTHADVVKANACLVVILLLIGIGGAL